MIKVSRLNGTELYVNPELILTVEGTPDTVITMTNGEKLVVRDAIPEILERFMLYRQQCHFAYKEPSLSGTT